jgi:hypothetical protein
MLTVFLMFDFFAENSLLILLSCGVRLRSPLKFNRLRSPLGWETADRVGERSRTRSVADRQYPTPIEFNDFQLTIDS